MQLNRVRVVTTGVAGAPAYMNLYTNNGLVTPGSAHAAAVAFVNGFNDMQANVAVNTIEGDVALVESTNNTIIGVTTVPQVTVNGTGGVNNMPPANQILVRWLTGAYAGGRQIRGRTYIPYPSTIAASPTGGVAATAVTAINAAVNAYLAAMGPGAPVVFSRVNGTGYAVSSFSVWTSFGVMRSRRD